jgi:hypothetical protein
MRPQRYCLEQHTVWGAVFATAPVYNAGANCVWGPAWAPSEGDVVMPLRAAKGSHVALRVLDYDFGMRDDVLGECLVDVDAVLAAGGAPVTLPLMRKQGLLRTYGPQLVAGAASVVTLSAVAEPDAGPDVAPEWHQGARRVRLRLHAALNLRSADLVGSNDVYVKLWELDPADLQPGAPLPEPPAKATMPQARATTFPFEFTLPVNLPSTLEGVPGVDYGFVRCSVYAHIDIAWRLNPSARAFISICQPVPASLPRLLAPVGAAGSHTVYGLRCCAACCCDCCLRCCGAGCCENRSNPLGDVSLEASLSRAAFAPGEDLPLAALRAFNGTATPVVLRIELVRDFSLTTYALPSWRTTRTAVTIFEAAVPPGAAVELAPRVTVPLLAPDYHGAPPGSQDYPPHYRSLGARWSSGRAEPLRWRTALRVTMDVPGTPFDLAHELPVFIAALPPSSAVAAPGDAQRAYFAQAPAPVAPMSAAAGGAACERDQASFFAVVGEEELRAAGVSLAAVAAAPPPVARGQDVFAKQPEEDMHCDEATLTYAPSYFVVVSPAPRFVVSPFMPGALVDVSACPPGSVALCPHTQQPFIVPYV